MMDCISIEYRFEILLVSVLVSLTLSSVVAKAEDIPLHIQEVNRGLAFIREDRYLEALEAFERSREIKPTASVLFNIGMCYKALFRYVESVEMLRKYVAHPKADPAVARDAEAAIQSMEILISHLGIAGAPKGSEVRVNGRQVGTTPLDAPLKLDPNIIHVIRIVRSGYHPFVEEVSMKQGEKRELQVSLVPEKAALTIGCKADAQVMVGDFPAKPCPFERDIPAGKYTVEVTSDGYKPYRETVNTIAGEATSISVALEKEGGPRPVDVKVASSPPTKWLILHGGVLSGVGLCGLAMGIVYHVQYNNAVTEGNAAAHRLNDETSTDEGHDTEIYEQAGKDMDRYRIGMLAGYIGAGVLISAGAVMIGIGSYRKWNRSAVSIYPTIGGVALHF
jgi:hypothetical protein